MECQKNIFFKIQQNWRLEQTLRPDFIPPMRTTELVLPYGNNDQTRLVMENEKVDEQEKSEAKKEVAGSNRR